jgi:hypothetical protein
MDREEVDSSDVKTVQPPLRQLHRKLAQVARRRRWSRRVAGGCAAVVALLWMLAVTFLLDLAFELDVVQRLIVLTLALATLAWAFARFVKPWFGVRESESELALMMEQRHRIDNDLIAAIQFEHADSSRWGSPRLQQSVIGSASIRSKQLDVRHTAHGKQTLQRTALLVISLLVAAGTCLFFPGHVTTFLRRLTLANAHYPAETVLQAVHINGDLVMTPADESTPRETRCAENEAVWFVVRCTEEIPDSGEIVIRGDQDRSMARVPLERISRRRRAAALDAVAAALGQTAGQADPPVELSFADLAIAQAELPQLRDVFVGTQLRDKPGADTSPLQVACEQAIAAAPRGVNFLGRIPEMVESLRYQIYLGDAWTNRARINMIPLPVIEPQFQVVPPKYAAAVEEPATYTGASSFTVLASSEVRLMVQSLNSRPLQVVKLRAVTRRAAQEYDLTPRSGSRLVWTLPDDHAALRSVTEQLQYELIAADDDGLRPRETLIGRIRVRPDQAPTAQIGTVHRVVLPEARPGLTLRVDDDYRVAKVRLRVEIERSTAERGDSDLAAPEIAHVDVATDRCPVNAKSLPLRTTYDLDLSPWKLVKGDELKLTLEVTDGRGLATGAVTLSEPLFLEVSDQAGVLAAISEADEDAERRLDEMIQQQLDAGEGG